MADVRKCPFCNTLSGVMFHDNTTQRAYECSQCHAVESITKGKQQWFYHGWQSTGNERGSGERVNGDGLRFPSNIPFVLWKELATAGNAR